jgi:Flp pilus assembly protein TadD
MIAHLISSTVTAAVAIGAVWALRRDRAAWRHAILLAAILRFVLPTQWVRVVPAIEFPDLTALAHPGAVETVSRAAAPVSGTLDWRIVWLAGTSVCLMAWARRAVWRIPAVRPPTCEEAQLFPGVPLRIVAPGHVPGACGLFQQYVVLPDGLSLHLTAAEMQAVVAHEMAHIRRWDNLTAALARAAASVFWFHPLLWWLERRMLAERETACDEMVLGTGIAPEEYVSGIAKVCRMSFAGVAGYAGVNGSNLHRRMEHIMYANQTFSSFRALRAAAAGLIAVATLLPIAGGRVRAQTAPPSAALVEAERHMAAGRPDDAIARLEAEIASNPSDRELKKALGNLMVRAGRYDRAINLLLGMLDGYLDAKQRADIYLRLGETYRRNGDYASAIATLEKARQLVPENVAAASTLGLVLDSLGRWQEAKQLYQQVMRLDPRNGIAPNNLAYLITEHGGDLDEALTLARRAKELLPNTWEVTDTLGWVSIKRGDLAAAVQMFADVVSKSPSNRSFRSHLLQALHLRGDTSEVVVELKQLLPAESSPEADQRIVLLARSLL